MLKNVKKNVDSKNDYILIVNSPVCDALFESDFIRRSYQ